MHIAETFSAVSEKQGDKATTDRSGAGGMEQTVRLRNIGQRDEAERKSNSGIPKRIIQTWKNAELPLLYRAGLANAKLLNPSFEHLFFDNQTLSEFVNDTFPEYREAFHAFKYPIQRYDFFRYLAVFHFGGFYFDLDVLLTSELTGLLNHACVFPFEELTLSQFLRDELGLDWMIGNYAFGAERGNPFLRAVIENCVRAQTDTDWVAKMMKGIPRMFHRDFYILNTTGPGLVSRTMAENPRLAEGVTTLFPDDLSDERKWSCFGEYGIHLMDHSWRKRPAFVHRLSFAVWLRWTRRTFLKRRPRMQNIGPSVTAEWVR
jgi:hypothetical protein